MTYIMTLWQILILVLELIVHISFAEHVYEDAMPFTKAIDHCRRNGQDLACITPEYITDEFPTYIKDIWIDTYSTFSSWIKIEGKLESMPDEEQNFFVPTGDIFTCQLLCSTNFFFAVQKNRCICFLNGDIIKDGAGDLTAYKSGSLKEFINDIDISVDIVCHYICPVEVDRLAISEIGITEDCFRENRILEVCTLNDIDINTCYQFPKYYATHKHLLRNLTCNVFKVLCDRRNCQSQGNGNIVGSLTVDRIGGLIKGIGLTSSTASINQSSALDIDNYIFSCYIGTLRMNNSQEIVLFREVTDCVSSHNFFCNTENTDRNGLCKLKSFATGRFINSDTSGQGNEITTERSTTRKIEDIPTGGNTDTQHISDDKGIVIGLVVTICILVFVIAGIFIVIYCKRIKQRAFKQMESNNSAFRNVAYESNPPKNTDGINKHDSDDSIYDFIKEQECSSIPSDSDDKCPPKTARLSHKDKEPFPQTKHQKKPFSNYTKLNKADAENVYNYVKVEDKTDTQQPGKDLRSGIAYDKTQNDYIILENGINERSVHCGNATETGVNKHENMETVTNNLKQSDSQRPQTDNDYIILEPEPVIEETSEEHKPPQPLPPDNYFILEKIDTVLLNDQIEEFDQEGDYVDSAENDYDHLHKKKRRRSQENDQGNFCAQTSQDSKTENPYDTTVGFKTDKCIDSSA